MTEGKQQLRVDVSEVLRSKNSKMAKIIPNFVIRLLKRLIHEDEINKLLGNAGHLQGKQFVKEALRELNISYEVSGTENIDPEKRYIFVSNHPLGGLDGMVLIKMLSEAAGPLKVIGNDLLASVKPLSNLFVPVNKHGAQTKDVLRRMNEIFTSGYNALFFPAGLCSRKKRGVICDLKWQKSFINFAIKYKTDIIPIFFSGRNSATFYRAANIRTALGIKFNYEMLLLPHEMFKQRNNHFEIIIGKPIAYTTLSASQTAAYWADAIKQETYKLNSK